MADAKLPRLTPLGGKYLRYLLSFVTLGLGLFPLLSTTGVPRFRAILDVFPTDLQDVIPWASLLMSLTAVGVQFFGGQAIADRLLTRAFIVTFVFLVVLTFVLYVSYKATVIRIHVPGADAKVAYLVGDAMLPTCECAKRNLEIRECIGQVMTTNPDDVAACYPRQEIAARTTRLSVLYMLLMFSLGMLVGLLVVKEAVPPKDKPARKRPRR